MYKVNLFNKNIPNIKQIFLNKKITKNKLIVLIKSSFILFDIDI